jgi:hypothetical protein
MDQRKNIGSFNNSNLNGNNAIQADNVTQSQNINQGISEKAFQDLFTTIQELKNETEKEKAQYFAEQMQEALQAGDKSKAQKLLGFLHGILGDVGSLASIASLFSLTIPLP